MTTTLWSGRFDGAPDAAAFDFGASFRFDRRLFEDDVKGSRAWARALGQAGVLPVEEAQRIDAALGAILERAASQSDFLTGNDEDVHSFVERLLVESLGDSGRRLHTGRSRNEQVSVDLRLYLKRRIPLLQRAVAGVVQALADQAEKAGDALMPAYTHFRPAQPVLVAHFLLSHAAPLVRDVERFAGALREADALPLGSGAIAGTAYAIDVDVLARDLGFARVVDN
ncbi:MAG TPA: lyase family protein, partial [Vicinamibacterales bacterium]